MLMGCPAQSGRNTGTCLVRRWQINQFASIAFYLSIA
jgi:hypothetical protein